MTDPSLIISPDMPCADTEEHDKPVFHNYSASDDRKVFCSRVPSKVDDSKLKEFLELQFSVVVEEVKLMEKDDIKANDDDPSPPEPPSSSSAMPAWMAKKQPTQAHLGYGFVLLSTAEDARILLDAGSCKLDKKHTVIIRPIQRTSGDNVGSNVCYLWSKGRCTHGDMCKFLHEGEGATLVKGDGKKKCFEWLQKGTCKKGAACPFRHREEERGSRKRKEAPAAGDGPACPRATPLDKKDKPCRNWKTKGFCRKKDKGCPYLHDPAVAERALAKKKARKESCPPSSSSSSNAAPAPPSNVNDSVSIRIEGYENPEEMKRSKIEKVLKEIQCLKPKRVKVEDESTVCSFNTSERAGEAMVMMYNFRDLFGGSQVKLAFI